MNRTKAWTQDTRTQHFHNAQKLMRRIVAVIWIRLCILTRIHKAVPLLCFYEEVKRCRKLNTSVRLTDWQLKLWLKNLYSISKSFSHFPSKNKWSQFQSETSISLMPMNENLKHSQSLSFLIYFIFLNRGSNHDESTVWAVGRVDFGWHHLNLFHIVFSHEYSLRI